MNLKPNTDLTTDKNKILFLSLAYQLCALLKSEGLAVSPCKSADRLYFSDLPLEIQIQRLENFRQYVEVCQDTKDQGHSLWETGFLLWNMLRKLGLKPQGDIFSKIDERQVVEIYNSENTQIFRNLNFFKVCSYSLDELLSIPWWKLFKRDDAIIRDIFVYASQILSGEKQGTLCSYVPTHLLEEINSESMLKVLVDIKYFSSLTGPNGQISAIVLEEARLVEN